MKPQHYIWAAVVSFLIAALGFSGAILKDDIVGRLIFGTVWSLVGIGWSTGTYRARLKARERQVRELRENLLAQVQDTAAQQERNRLARNLHDSIKQQIFSISMSSAAAQTRWDTDPQGAQEALADVQRSAQEAMAEMNALLQQLSPAPLEKVGLVQSLRDQCKALGYRTDAQVTVKIGELPADDRLPAGAQERLFRIAQEALGNIARHARADHVHLYLGQQNPDSPLVLEIVDDGQGFEVNTVGGGMGLENIRQRVLALGGKLTIDSTPGNGTTLCATIPLVERIISYEELGQKQDHTLTKVFGVGLGGGLVLIATLFYPLYVLLPGRYVQSWPAASEGLGLLLEIIAPLLVIATGFLATRWAKADTRQSGLLFGALAGATAGVILYLGLAAPAASMAGSHQLFRYGHVSFAGDADYVQLLAESLTGITAWSHGVFWATLAAGVGLGAIGSLLASPVGERTGGLDQSRSAEVILAAAAVVSALTLCTTTAIGTTMERESPLEGVLFWLAGTPAIFYIASLVALYYVQSAKIRTEDPVRLRTAQNTTTVFGLLSLGVPLYLRAVNPDLVRATSALGIASIVAVAIIWVLGMLYVATFIRIQRRRRALGLLSFYPMQAVAVVGVFLNVVAIIWAVNLSLGFAMLIALVLIAVDIALIALLQRQAKRPLPEDKILERRQWLSQSISGGLGSAVAMIVPPMAAVSTLVSIVVIAGRFAPALSQERVPDLAELVRQVYLTQAQAFLVMVVANIVVVGLTMLVSGGIMTLSKYRPALTAETDHENE